jgi:hypothetical protein
MTERHESEIASELERLTRQYGGTLKPQAVVDAARDPASPLHHSFTWDNTEAAESWRRHQARMLIRAVVRYEPVGEDKVVPYRMFVSLTPDREKEGQGYRLTTSVMADAEQRQQLLADALSEMRSFQRKYRSLNELSKVFDAMSEAEQASLLTTDGRQEPARAGAAG